MAEGRVAFDAVTWRHSGSFASAVAGTFAATIVASTALTARAQTYPDHALRLIVPLAVPLAVGCALVQLGVLS